MSGLQETFGQILGAAEQFLDEGEYERVVIQSNRLLTVGALFSRDPDVASVAIALRLAGQDLALASAEDAKLDIGQKQLFERLLSGFREYLATAKGRTGRDPSQPWTLFAAFKSGFWAKSRGEVEGRSYTPNEQAIDEILKWAKESLGRNWELTKTNRGAPFLGVANEVDWAVRAFNASPRQFASYALISTLAWESEYLRWAHSAETRPAQESPTIRAFEVAFRSALDLIHPAAGGWSDVNALLADLGGMWRSDFITFFDLFVREQERIHRIAAARSESSPKPHRKGFRKDRGD